VQLFLSSAAYSFLVVIIGLSYVGGIFRLAFWDAVMIGNGWWEGGYLDLPV